VRCGVNCLSLIVVSSLGRWWIVPQFILDFLSLGALFSESAKRRFKPTVVVSSPRGFYCDMPFAVQHGVTSIEVWECSLDYAFTTSTTYESLNENSAEKRSLSRLVLPS
jgi:hypothetical protein